MNPIILICSGPPKGEVSEVWTPVHLTQHGGTDSFGDHLVLKRVVANQSDILHLQAVSLASVVFLSKICSAFRPDYGEEEGRVFSWVLPEAGTHELITGCLPPPLITASLMCFYFQVIYDRQHTSTHRAYRGCSLYRPHNRNA